MVLKNDAFLLIRNEGILKSSATYSYQSRELTITGASSLVKFIQHLIKRQLLIKFVIAEV